MRTFLFIVCFLIVQGCKDPIHIESKETIISDREESHTDLKRGLGGNRKEILANLREAQSYADLLRYTEPDVIKANLRIRKIGESFFLITEAISDQSVESNTKGYIQYLLKEDSLRLVVIENINIGRVTVIENTIIKMDENFIENILIDHNSRFNSNHQINDFIHVYSTDRTFWQYNDRGYALQGSDLEKMMIEIQNGETEFILQLLRSLCPVDQALGTIGTVFLQYLDCELDHEIIRYREQILKSNHEFSAYMGCTHQLVTISEFLSNTNWRIVLDLNLGYSNRN